MERGDPKTLGKDRGNEKLPARTQFHGTDVDLVGENVVDEPTWSA